MAEDKAMRIAYTGGTGFTGSFVLPQLLGAGHEVRALARNPDALKGKCKDVVVGSMNDEAELRKLVQGVDIVVHAAGTVSGNNRQDYFDVNVEATMRLFALAKEAGVKRFIYISSLTAREPKLSHYGASKAAAEEFLLAQGPSVLILRPPAIYGPGDKATLPLVKMMQSRVAFLPGRKHGRFSLLHISDFARVVCEAVESSRNGIFELDDQSLGYSWYELAMEHKRQTGRPERVVFLPQGVAHVVASVAESYARITGGHSITSRQKMAEVYHNDWVAHGWIWPIARPVQMRDGLEQVLNWYDAQGWLPKLKQGDRSAA